MPPSYTTVASLACIAHYLNQLTTHSIVQPTLPSLLEAMPWVTHVSPEVDKSSQYPAILAVSLTLTTLMTIFVALRAYVRAAIARSLGGDDYVIFVSAVSSADERAV